jgi:hypothetical protein
MPSLCRVKPRITKALPLTADPQSNGLCYTAVKFPTAQRAAARSETGTGPDGVGRGRSGLVGEQERAQIRSGWVRRNLRRTQHIDNWFRFIDKRAIYRK